jgi:hypothetical protein
MRYLFAFFLRFFKLVGQVNLGFKPIAFKQFKTLESAVSIDSLGKLNLVASTPLIVLSFFCFLSSASAQEKEFYILNRGAGNILIASLDTSITVLTEKYNQDLRATYDFGFDAASSKLFWIGSIEPHIRYGQTDGEFTSTIVDSDVGTPVDLEIDDFHAKMYWADNTRKKVYRANFDGSMQEVVTKDSISNISGIALLPSEDLIFYAEIDSGRIWSSSLTGENPKIFVQSLEGTPVRLLIDTIQRKLYWSDDTKHLIERINLDGSEREVFHKGSEEEYPFGLYLDQFNTKFYWTDYGTDKIMSANLSGLELTEFIKEGLADPIALTMVPKNGGRPAAGSDRDDSRLERSAVSVYPNPADSRITFVSLVGTQNMEQIWIFDGVGKQVFSHALNEPRVQLDAKIFSEGLYAYSVLIAGQILSGRFSIIR